MACIFPIIYTCRLRKGERECRESMSYLFWNSQYLSCQASGQIFQQIWIIVLTLLTGGTLEGRRSPSRNTELSNGKMTAFTGKEAFFSHSFHNNFLITPYTQTPVFIKLKCFGGYICQSPSEKKCHTQFMVI